ncbi:hypothetical protein MTR67_024093 [Solanum verrucosum]|uniref:Uncharacterized protein n=1 Tax=Solanum verrucosum TaxID=315347 RepID=A0AAF0QYE8_SOLVR|nr:hypothetical protein MTR67_024093 [Solanum verrucosum]
MGKLAGYSYKKINIAGIYVTCFDANHCPGSLIILFEPPNGQVWFKLICPVLFLNSSLISLVMDALFVFYNRLPCTRGISDFVKK